MTRKESNLYLNWFKFQSINTEVSLVPLFLQWNFLAGLDFHNKLNPIPFQLPSVDGFLFSVELPCSYPAGLGTPKQQSEQGSQGHFL